jgi:hypothetical protein
MINSKKIVLTLGVIFSLVFLSCKDSHKTKKDQICKASETEIQNDASSNLEKAYDILTEINVHITEINVHIIARKQNFENPIFNRKENDFQNKISPLKSSFANLVENLKNLKDNPQENLANQLASLNYQKIIGDIKANLSDFYIPIRNYYDDLIKAVRLYRVIISKSEKGEEIEKSKNELSDLNLNQKIEELSNLEFPSEEFYQLDSSIALTLKDHFSNLIPISNLIEESNITEAKTKLDEKTEFESKNIKTIKTKIYKPYQKLLDEALEYLNHISSSRK